MSETKRWFDSIQQEIAHDYDDAQLTHKEDIQRSGHEGESTWVDLLSKWLPQQYGVGLRKYIIGSDETIKPFETDLVVFEPAYPQHLRYRAKVHAGGIAAAFSVKLTARKRHFKEIANWSRSLSKLSSVDITTVEGQLISGIPTGFLAHSHDLGTEPVDNLATGFEKMADSAVHPRDLVDIVCVASIGTLTCSRASYIPQSQYAPGTSDYVMSSYIRMNDEQEYGAVAHFIVSLYAMLGRSDPSMRKFAKELAQVTETGQGRGTQRKWDPSLVYDEDFLINRRHHLFNEGSPRIL
ncbi:DUF6602 domain-containing protein [Arthrobacter sp. Hz1]